MIWLGLASFGLILLWFGSIWLDLAWFGLRGVYVVEILDLALGWLGFEGGV